MQMANPRELPDSDATLNKLTAILRGKFGPALDHFLIPPPVFTSMEGEFLAFDQTEGWLRARFPIKQEYLNPYKVMQGGMIAAAIDNTLGPLSILIAPPNLTRTLEIKYSAPIPLDLGSIIVTAQLIAREGNELRFKVEVRSDGGKLLTRASARHWITPVNTSPDNTGSDFVDGSSGEGGPTAS